MACLAGNDYLDDNILRPVHAKLGILPKHSRDERLKRVLNYLSTGGYKPSRIQGFLTDRLALSKAKKAWNRFETSMSRYKMLESVHIDSLLATPPRSVPSVIFQAHLEGLLPSVIIGTDVLK